jgi:uncharacterized short protein YbdD (DUF466 family)
VSGPGDRAPAPPPAVSRRLSGVLRCLCDGARLMVGVPRYEDYLSHMAEQHPGKPVMTYAEFFRDRQVARYAGTGGGGLRCC